MAGYVKELPQDLKSAIKTLSGFTLDDVRVHYDSPRPANINALAYAQGTNIYLGPGQEHLLSHEAWHVVQQMQGRVQPTTVVGGMPVNDNAELEHEADLMGQRAMRVANGEEAAAPVPEASRKELKDVAQLNEVTLQNGKFTSKWKSRDEQNGVEMTLKFQPNIEGDDVVGLIQIVYSTKPVDTVDRRLKTAPSGYAIDSQSNNPVYGSANLQEYQTLSDTQILSSKKAKNICLSVMEEGGCCCGSKRTPAILYDAPQFVGNGRPDDIMCFEVYAFDLESSACLGAVLWSFDLIKVNDVHVVDIAEVTDYKNFNSAASKWNTLRVNRGNLSFNKDVHNDNSLPEGQFYGIDPMIGNGKSGPKDSVWNGNSIVDFKIGGEIYKGKINVNQNTYSIVQLPILP